MLIFFCEDCGEKNSISPEQITNDIVSFRCGSCRYYNSYPVPGKKRRSVDTEVADHAEVPEVQFDLGEITRQLIDQMNTLEEVTGIFIFYQNHVVLLSPEPEGFTKGELRSIGELLTENYHFGQKIIPDINEIMLGKKKRIIIYNSISNDLFFAVMCQSFPVSRRCRALLDRVVSGLRTYLV